MKTFKARRYHCRVCDERREELAWEDDIVLCCDQPMTETRKGDMVAGQAPAVHGDEIDVMVEHGVCHSDGSPRRFRSRAELRRALDSKGLMYSGDTPKPNRNRWI